MAWIESHQELADHPKTKRAARRLGISIPQMVGHLHCLWWWAMDYAPDGDLLDFDDEDVADAARWEGDPGEFIDALQCCGTGDGAGFLTSGNELNDWDQYGGKYLKRREQARDRQRKRRKQAGDSPNRHADVTRDSHNTSETGSVTGAETGRKSTPEAASSSGRQAARNRDGGAENGDVTRDTRVSHAARGQDRTGKERKSAPDKPARTRRRNPIWDALLETCPAPSTPSEESDFGKTVSELRSAQATPDEIAAFPAWWDAEMPPGTMLTHRCYRHHWSTFKAGVIRATGQNGHKPPDPNEAGWAAAMAKPVRDVGGDVPF